MKIIASGIPETLEQYQLALNAAWAGGRAYGQGEAKLKQAFLEQKPQYTTTRNAWTGKAIHTCTHCGRDDFRSEHSARFRECKQEPTIDLGKYAGTYGGYIKD